VQIKTFPVSTPYMRRYWSLFDVASVAYVTQQVKMAVIAPNAVIFGYILLALLMLCMQVPIVQ